MEKILSSKPYFAVIHLAAIASVQRSTEEPDYCHAVNYKASIELKDLAIKHDIQRFIFDKFPLCEETVKVLLIKIRFIQKIHRFVKLL